MNAVLSNLDMFAPSVEFTFKEKRRHGTALGGCCSVLAVFIISFYTVTSLAHIILTDQYFGIESQKSQIVTRLTPKLKHQDKYTTFPAVDILFQTPNETVDPWDYVASIYTVSFREVGGDRESAVPCDEVEGYSNDTLSQADLIRGSRHE